MWGRHSKTQIPCLNLEATNEMFPMMQQRVVVTEVPLQFYDRVTTFPMN